MRKNRKAEDRGHFNLGWLDTWHSFSFGEYFDPDHHPYRSLGVLPGLGFGTHGHRDMKILTEFLWFEVA